MMKDSLTIYLSMSTVAISNKRYQIDSFPEGVHSKKFPFFLIS